MSYIREAVAVAAVVLPLILLYKLLYGRRSFEDLIADDDNEYTIQLTDSTSLVDESSGTSDFKDPPIELTDSTFVADETSNSPIPSISFPSVEYEVFLSFRGPDTRHQITDILYRFLCRTKIHTFKDDNELRKGEEIGLNLLTAIDQSKIYVPIISRNYAHSKWCLIELAEIIRRQEQDPRRIILPIFYMVDPRDVRHQTGPYQNAFQQHAAKFDEKTVQDWKDALNKVGSLKGWHVESNDKQGAIADEVSADIWSLLSKENFTLAIDELVGIDDLVEAVLEKLSLDSKSLTMVGLHGMGGIGKTTIAKAIYNQISPRFDRCCFVENIRETQTSKDGIVVLQKKLLSDILRQDSVDITNDSGGRKMIKERVSRFKVFIVFDDVDEKFKFHDILGNPKDFASQSRFIITSRNEKVLSTLNENKCKLYEVGSMSQSRSLELFSKHAFKNSSPPPDYQTLAKDIVSTTGGLPLTLKVIGSLLFREEIAVWKDKLEQLHETLKLDEVLDRLKISYEALDYEAQQIFLDIACFFTGKNKEMPSYIWSDCKFYPASNISILIQRSMIKVGDNGEFKMHDQLRDMGREIVRREDIERPWMRSRIWSAEEGRELLSNKKVSSQIKALRVEGLEIDADELRSKCLMHLSELRYFEAESSTILTGDFENILPNLRWLQLRDYWQWYRSTSALTNFNMKNLVIFYLYRSDVNENWGGWSQFKMAQRLKVMDLSYCSELTRLPYLPKSLEIFRLSHNKEHEIPELDIGELKNLKVLQLRSIAIRKISGGTFGMLKGLQELDLCHLKCENLREIIRDVGELSSSLIFLNTQGAIEVDYKTPTGLKKLYTSSRISNLADMLELEVLEVEYCKHGLDIPPLWWKVSKLKTLSLTQTKMYDTGSNNTTSTMLPSSLASLQITNCHVWLPSLVNLRNLTRIEMRTCRALCNHMDGLEGLKSLQSLQICRVKGLTRITGLIDLLYSPNCKLEELRIVFCPDLAELQPVNDLVELQPINSLHSLTIGYCRQLEAGPLIRGLLNFSMLNSLVLVKVNINTGDDIHQFEGLGSLEELKQLFLWNVLPPSLERIHSLSRLQKLRMLTIVGAPSLREIQGLGELKSLEDLNLPICPSLERLWPADYQPSFPSLKRLDIRNSKSLSVEHLSTLKTSLPNVEIRWPDEPIDEVEDYETTGDVDDE